MKFCVNFNEIFNLRISKLCAKGPRRRAVIKQRFDLTVKAEVHKIFQAEPLPACGVKTH